jgi:hypothetical protein
MNIIKEFCPGAGNGPGTCVVRSDSYNHTVGHINHLMGIISDTYPKIDVKAISVELYGGDRFKHTTGLEFSPPESPPDDWTRISRLETAL